ncbi:helix-turn-helix domain-containing protein [Yinghuangia sp. YIM S09857]|uniref:helix-turn-helix domain-containing protein n=1 Tax=Yinghuangia sp. YIM S09857 TaxID=3436929 RepID=UPI003F53772E
MAAGQAARRRAARTATGWTMSELVSRAGASPSVISRLEGGQQAQAQMERAHAIAAALGSDVESLGHARPPPPNSRAPSRSPPRTWPLRSRPPPSWK